MRRPPTTPTRRIPTRHTARISQSANAAGRGGQYGSLLSLDLDEFDDEGYQESEVDDISVAGLRGLVEDQQEELT